MGRDLVAVLVAVLAAILVAGCSGSSGSDDDRAAADSTTSSSAIAASTTIAASATTTVAPPTTTLAGDSQLSSYEGSDFYDDAATLPLDGDHGTLLAFELVEPSIVTGALTYRIAYASESLVGEPIVVTGTALVPEGAAPAGGRPLLSMAHGTTGIADLCAPSLDPGRELKFTAERVAQGWLVAETDYEGLGTPGRHPYLVGESEGRGVLDAIVAAGQLPNAEPSAQLAIAGYSQGGHGAIWASQVAESWTPQLTVVGTFAGAPATEIPVIFRAAPGGFLVLMVAGFAAAYPEADPATFFNDEGLERMAVVDEGCVLEVFASLGSTNIQDLILPEAALSEPWNSLAAANNPGEMATDIPMLIIHSEADDVVPAGLSAVLTERLCGLGQQVERRVVTDGLGHVEAAPSAIIDGLDWLADRFAGGPVTGSTC